MKYHQSPKTKHMDRVSALSKIEDKYDYSNIQFPASYEDIASFEERNKVSIFIYAIDGEKIVKEKTGHEDYYTKDLVNLLRIEDNEKSHYVYVKNISNLLKLCHGSDGNNRSFCQFCQNKVPEDKFKAHLASCYNIAKNVDCTILQMPNKDSKMKFWQHKICLNDLS